ncbi:hypothetical protein [Mycolicibacterium sphagni]|uniref:Uncharacterized protein n=2 Tax=Mycolicibacterium sphagni TaxID=1786 RepID=A0A255DU42_9MYCO|nr:hypothetical protein [Mycolicibacterium sphagni]MCV7178316.1 hypothetical protein [Mycolicibacterium sphagni]OYN79163.1 hypothetical protein CG716_12350 [Mycolicibacterium sphagni]
MSTFSVNEFPIGVQIPIVLSVWAESGSDHDPHLYAVAHDPDGARRGTVEIFWHWPDVEGQPCKVGVRVLHLAFIATKPGTYRVRLYDDFNSTETDHSFPLIVTPQAPGKVGLKSSNILIRKCIRR